MYLLWLHGRGLLLVVLRNQHHRPGQHLHLHVGLCRAVVAVVGSVPAGHLQHAPLDHCALWRIVGEGAPLQVGADAVERGSVQPLALVQRLWSIPDQSGHALVHCDRHVRPHLRRSCQLWKEGHTQKVLTSVQHAAQRWVVPQLSTEEAPSPAGRVQLQPSEGPRVHDVGWICPLQLGHALGAHLEGDGGAGGVVVDGVEGFEQHAQLVPPRGQRRALRRVVSKIARHVQQRAAGQREIVQELPVRHPDWLWPV
mmetsp:Transcript_18797/g.41882  ORF Transcript_18797/g.41882 Transcript_18797/m.41882 type:complete len:254 (-) Transcript_18797:1419-2180(-)